MFQLKWMIPIACISTAVMAQSASDLNGLVTAASHYVSDGMAGVRDPETLALNRIAGDYSSKSPDVLMTKATDVQHWTFTYKINAAPAELPADQGDKPKPHLAVQAECTQGVFNNFHFSSTPVRHTKSLEYTWVAVPLDTAIQDLNTNGYVRGFTSVELVRPDVPNLTDEYVYVFNCPWERQRVAISCQTGALTWTYSY